MQGTVSIEKQRTTPEFI